jgi:hypothetical protein
MSKIDLRLLLQSLLPTEQPANDNKPAAVAEVKPRPARPPRPKVPARMNRALRPRRRT